VKDAVCRKIETQMGEDMEESQQVVERFEEGSNLATTARGLDTEMLGRVCEQRTSTTDHQFHTLAPIHQKRLSLARETLPVPLQAEMLLQLNRFAVFGGEMVTQTQAPLTPSDERERHLSGMRQPSFV
jgi:hypothetical protein